jgi:hypothetical protein
MALKDVSFKQPFAADLRQLFFHFGPLIPV